MNGFIRVGAAVPSVSVADCTYNTHEIISMVNDAEKLGIRILAFPELCITSYSCADLFFQENLMASAEKSLTDILEATKNIDIFITVGLPVLFIGQTFNCAVAIHKGAILGIVPKTSLPNYGDFYEKRWFTSGAKLKTNYITFCGQDVPINTSIIFEADGIKNLVIGLEICEDLWTPFSPSLRHCLSGATLILNISASNELAGKNKFRSDLAVQQSSRCICGYVYTSAGVGESTQDTVFGGHSLICENGTVISENKRFSKENQLIYNDIDLDLIVAARRSNMSYLEQITDITPPLKIAFHMSDTNSNLVRSISPSPFLPSNKNNIPDFCDDIFSIQFVGLAKRFIHSKSRNFLLGISGGLDSTLALLVAVKSCDYLGIDRSHVIGITMPGFGTTDRTYNNALNLMNTLGIRSREISIKNAALQHFSDIGHNPAVHDVTYENTQARERTQILMDIANMENGLVVGTGDLSELALGWATYNGDHMSMYGVNAGIPKTLIRILVDYISYSNIFEEKSSKILIDILDTPVSPELLPPDGNGEINQKTEEIVGPYELHDFFLYYAVRFGFSPKKIYYLASNAFLDVYDSKTILKWLKNFYSRFFSQQFKRSCMPDGPKVVDISLSPRSTWRMPSDASNRIWMDELDAL